MTTNAWSCNQPLPPPERVLLQGDVPARDFGCAGAESVCGRSGPSADLAIPAQRALSRKVPSLARSELRFHGFTVPLAVAQPLRELAGPASLRWSGTLTATIFPITSKSPKTSSSDPAGPSARIAILCSQFPEAASHAMHGKHPQWLNQQLAFRPSPFQFRSWNRRRLVPTFYPRRNSLPCGNP